MIVHGRCIYATRQHVRMRRHWRSRPPRDHGLCVSPAVRTAQTADQWWPISALHTTDDMDACEHQSHIMCQAQTYASPEDCPSYDLSHLAMLPDLSRGPWVYDCTAKRMQACVAMRPCPAPVSCAVQPWLRASLAFEE